MTAHIKGPWIVKSMQAFKKSFQVTVTASAPISLESTVDAFAVLEANARLISAAPDLLEALVECQQGEHEGSACWCAIPSMIPYRGHDAGCSAARAAIAKATGGEP